MMDKHDGIEAGDFASWLDNAIATLQGRSFSDVPCGDCRGCCRSAYFIHVRPTDKAALSVLPKAMLSPAPGWPAGHRLIGYDRHGACPMLKPAGCSIYAQRPRTCRDYDCRVFVAAGIEAEADKAEINRRIRAWRFTFANESDQRVLEAIRAAASFLRDKRHAFPGGRAPSAPSDIAVMAIKVYPVFLGPNLADKADTEIATEIIARSRVFDADCIA